MKPIYFLPFLSLLLLTPTSGNAAGSMLRISCEGDDVGAEVLINGKFRGECPIDLQVPEGQLKLLVRKKVDAQRERVFEQEIRMGEGSVKKVEAKLGAAKLNAGEEARRAENLRRLRGMSLEALENEATAGNVEAMFKLADQYWNGSNATPRTEELAGIWFRKAADAGHVEAMHYFSIFLVSRKGVPDDQEQSQKWRLRAAEAGSVDAMLGLADRYRKGAGLPKNGAEALHWYRRAAEQGSTLGMIMVGVNYYSGLGGVSQNDVEALAWWRKAADAGDSRAMYRVGRSYAQGEGVAKSEEQAIVWWRKAVKGGNPSSEAVKALKERGLR